MQKRSASIVQVRMQCMKNMGNSPSTVVWQSATWHSHHFGSRLLVTTWSQILQLLQTGAEIWAQFCNCPECWVHPVCCWWCWPKLKFTGCPNIFHGMGVIANILPGRPTLRGNPTLNCENGWATSCWPNLDMQFCYIFCGVTLTEIRNTEVQIAVTIQHQILSGNCLSHIIPGLSKSKHYTGIHIQASVLSILCHDRHWPWRNTYLCDTAKCYSTMFIFMYDHPLWWKSITIIKNKPELSNLHGIVLRLDGFHTLINSLEVVDHILAG